MWQYLIITLFFIIGVAILLYNTFWLFVIVKKPHPLLNGPTSLCNRVRVSESARGMLKLWQNNRVFNMGLLMNLDPPAIDISTMERALDILQERNSLLRTSVSKDLKEFVLQDGPVQRIPLVVRKRESDDNTISYYQSVCEKELATRFGFDPPLVRVVVIQPKENDSGGSDMIIIADHRLGDGNTFSLIVSQLLQIYDAIKQTSQKQDNADSIVDFLEYAPIKALPCYHLPENFEDYYYTPLPRYLLYLLAFVGVATRYIRHGRDQMPFELDLALWNSVRQDPSKEVSQSKLILKEVMEHVTLYLRTELFSCLNKT